MWPRMRRKIFVLICIKPNLFFNASIWHTEEVTGFPAVSAIEDDKEEEIVVEFWPPLRDLGQGGN